jgi:hypothetical protein
LIFSAQGLKKQLVTSYNDISKLMDEGTANRTIAATNMNATSRWIKNFIFVFKFYLNFF